MARYWVGGGASTNWNATGSTNWSATSGGTGNATIPTSSDDVFFDSNSGAGAAVISAGISIQSINCTGFIGTITHGAFTLTIANSLTFVTGMTYTPTGGATSIILFSGTTTGNTIITGGKTLPTVTINNASGSWLLGSTFTSGNFNITAGTFTANNFNLSIVRLAIGVATIVNCGSGTWSLAGTVATLQVASGCTFNYNTATFTLTTISNTTKNIDLNGNSIYNLILNASTQVNHKYYFISDARIVNTLTITGKNHIEFAAGGTYTVNFVKITGTLGSEITMDTDSAGTSASLVGNGGTYNFNWVNLTDIAASNGIFNSYHSVDGGGNTGWNIHSGGFSSGNNLLNAFLSKTKEVFKTFLIKSYKPLFSPFHK